MKIAFSSSNGISVDAHFGWTKVFYLYDVEENCSKLLEVIECAKEIEDEKEKLQYKIEMIEEADLMYCTQIGPTASKMVLACGIHPVRVAEGEKIQSAITQLQKMLAEEPPVWLLRIFHKAKAKETKCL